MKRVKFSASSITGLRGKEPGRCLKGRGPRTRCPPPLFYSPHPGTHTLTVSTSGGHQPRISQVRRVSL